MPLTLPNLDDRTYADLTEEARGLLVTYAPALTNHNPSDPTVTLIELFAYVAEILLFRLNYVTDASRTAFLRLLNGPDWQAPTTSAGLDAEIRRTVLMLRRTDRAVTPADFDFLALAADPGIARAHCVPERNLEVADPTLRANPAPGHMSVVIVPKAGVNLAGMISKVVDQLAPRRLLTTQVHVVGARVVPLGVRFTLRLLPDARAGDVRDSAKAALLAFFDPFTGRGTGWPFGRNVFVSEMYRLLDSLSGVDFVSRTRDGGGNQLDEVVTADAARVQRNAAGELISVALADDELPQLTINDGDLATEIPAIVF